MGKRQARFTDDDIQELSKNPYTLSVTGNRLSVTLAAKEKILELFNEGRSRRQIMAELGYDPDLLGDDRVKISFAVQDGKRSLRKDCMRGIREQQRSIWIRKRLSSLMKVLRHMPS